MTESIKNIYFSLTENSFQHFQVNNNEVFFFLMQDHVASTYYEWLSSLTQGLKECMVFEIIKVK